MEVRFGPRAHKDLAHWKATGDKKIQKKISDLVISISENPFAGIGKPEPLKHEFAGCWSRRINKEHRLIYAVNDSIVEILSLKDHY